jgi:hypothetical protein
MVPEADPSAETHEISRLEPNNEVYAILVPSADHDVLVNGAAPDVIVVRLPPLGFMTPTCVLY